MKIIYLLISLRLLSGCAPKIYIIDRQTVLEQEAAGHWPEFEKEMFEKGVANGPTPFGKAQDDSRRAKLLTILNGDLSDAKE